MNYILQACLFIGLAAVVYVFVKAAPRVGDLPQEKKEPFHWAKRLPLGTLDNFVNRCVGKWLRKNRVFLMKFDNFISRQLDKVKDSKQASEKREEIFKQTLPDNNIKDIKEEKKKSG